MIGYLIRNSSGVKEIRDGDVRTLWDLSSYRVRHSMSASCWGMYWEDKIKWEVAKIIKIYPATYFAFPEEGKVDYELFGMYAIPLGFDKSLLMPKASESCSSKNRRFERLVYQDGGYKVRRYARDSGL